MKSGLKLSLLLAALFLTYTANAQTPSYVTGIEAEIKDGKVVVRWNAQLDEDVAFYRVYYSFESILENEGLYDDFEETEDATNEYTFENLPDVDILYIAVMAVGAGGEEINLFVEEATIDLTSIAEEKEEMPETLEEELEPGTDVMTSEGSGETLEVQDETFVLPTEEGVIPLDEDVLSGSVVTSVGILSIEATSPTEISIKLSAPITVEPTRAPEAFRIVDAFGQILPIIQMDIVENVLTVKTAEQNPERIYEFRMSEPAMNMDGLPFDPERRRAYFTGHPLGKIDDPTPTEELGISDFVLDSYTQPNGLFTVIGKWKLNGNRMDLKEYHVYQTRDEGKTMGTMEILTSDISGVQLTGVTPGQFGMSIIPVDVSGAELAGVFQSIPVGGSSDTLTAQVASLPSTPVSSPAPTSDLPDTGAGTAFAIAIAGGFMGWRRMRKLTPERLS